MRLPRSQLEQIYRGHEEPTGLSLGTVALQPDQLPIPLGPDRLGPTLQFVEGRHIADRAVQSGPDGNGSHSRPTDGAPRRAKTAPQDECILF
jgi:hypothetical protein